MLGIWDLTLNGPGGGLNQDAPCLEACHLPPDAPRSIRPQCKFVFWCLELLGEKKIWGCKKKFSKNSRFKIFFQKLSIKKKIFFLFFQNFSTKKIFLFQIWVQYYLSFHLMYILYVFEAKIRFSKIFIPNLGKFLLLKYINSAWPYGKTRQARMLIIDSTDHWRPKF